jgi:hypothetical protein
MQVRDDEWWGDDLINKSQLKFPWFSEPTTSYQQVRHQ